MIATKLKSLSGEYPMTVGSFLKDKRKAVGLTQKEVAEKAGIGLPTYKQYERDGASPPLKNVTKLATVLQFQPIEIIEEAEDDQRTDDDVSITKARTLIKELAVVLGADVLADAIEAHKSEGISLDIPQDNQSTNQDNNLWRGIGIERLNRIVSASTLTLEQAKVLITDALGDMTSTQLEELSGAFGITIYHDDIINFFEGDEPRIEAKGLFESRERYAARLRVELLPHVVMAWKKGAILETDETEDEFEEEPETDEGLF